MRVRQAGLTLIELILVVTMIGIVSAIVSPLLRRAQGAGFEASTIGSLRAIHSAEACSPSLRRRLLRASLSWMSTKPPRSNALFIGSEFKTNTFVRQHYTLRFTKGTVVAGSPVTCNGLAKGMVVSTYLVAADL